MFRPNPTASRRKPILILASLVATVAVTSLSGIQLASASSAYTGTPGAKPPVVHNVAASLANCTANGTALNLTLTNKGNVPETFVVRANYHELGAGISVPAGQTVTKTYSFVSIHGFKAGKSITVEAEVKAADKKFKLTALTNCAPKATTPTTAPKATTTTAPKATTTTAPKATTTTTVAGSTTTTTVAGSTTTTTVAGSTTTTTVAGSTTTTTVAGSVSTSSVQFEAVCNVTEGSGARVTLANTGTTATKFDLSWNIKDVAVNGVKVDQPSLKGSMEVAVPAASARPAIVAIFDQFKLHTINANFVADIKATDKTTNKTFEKTVLVHCLDVSAVTTNELDDELTDEVLGESIERGELAFTGTDSTPYIIIGSILLLIGATMLGLGRRVRQA